jgi:glyoxylase-like metal-dependent hydrolase (beta-lactamase superfamily II)
MIQILPLTFLIGLLAVPASADTATPMLPAPQQVAPHSWVWVGPYGPPTKENQGFRMNLGFVVGTEAVAVIDSGYGDPMAEAMLAGIRAVTDKPVRYVIDTNSQPHRVLGNDRLRREGAQIIADAEAAPRITGDGEAMSRSAEGVLGLPAESVTPPGAPDRTIESDTEIDLGGVRLRLIPVGQAHTQGSLIVEVPEDRMVYAGDVLYGGRLLAVLPASRVSGWIAAFDRLRGFPDARFVPGHGVPGTLADFEHPTYAYLTTLKTHMDAAVEAGTDLSDAITTLDQSPWKGLADFDELAGRNAHQAYLEAEAASFQ